MAIFPFRLEKLRSDNDPWSTIPENFEMLSEKIHNSRALTLNGYARVMCYARVPSATNKNVVEMDRRS